MLKGFNAIPKTLKLLEESLGKMLQDIGNGKSFLFMTTNTGSKANTDKWDYIRPKKLLDSNGNDCQNEKDSFQNRRQY